MKALLAALAIVLPAAAQAAERPAEQTCAPFDVAANYFLNAFQERPAALALVSNGYRLDVLASAGGATWTILLTSPKGVACPLAVGENWRVLPLPPPGLPL